MECRNEYRQDIGTSPTRSSSGLAEQEQYRWRVYSDDLSFFALFPRLWLDILQPTDSENLLEPTQVDRLSTAGPATKLMFQVILDEFDIADQRLTTNRSTG